MQRSHRRGSPDCVPAWFTRRFWNDSLHPSNVLGICSLYSVMIHPPTELIQAAQRGDPADVERLLETVWPDAYRLARAIVAQAQAAEDAAQDACVLMFRNIASLRNPDAFGTWFYRIVVREALKHKGLQATDAPLD